MGRVDEAMRRAAERGNDALSGEGRSTEVGGPVAALPAVPEVFPTEVPHRAHLRSVASPPAEPAESVLLPVLSDRVRAGLSKKVVIDRDMDPASKEQYRRLATSLHAAQATNGLRVVMVASALASEGKSLTASNLAMTFSESYQKNVLLIDADLRRPSLHTVFDLSGSPGLTEGLAAPEDSKLTLHHVSQHLTVLTAGEPTTDPMAALASERMRRLIDEARETFDWVVVDTPPVGLLSDASLLSEAVDGALLVVRAEETPYDVVQRAVAMLGKERVLGVILNRARGGAASDYKYHSYYQASPGPTPSA